MIDKKLTPPLNFREKTLKEIRMWAWAAAVLPITALAGIFFFWTFGFDSWIGRAMVIGETTMFAVAVIWWWWAMYVIKQVVNSWATTNRSILDVLNEVKEVRSIVADEIESTKVNT
jgi:hypothetical protein